MSRPVIAFSYSVNSARTSPLYSVQLHGDCTTLADEWALMGKCNIWYSDGGNWAGLQPTQALLAVSNGQCTNYSIRH